MLIQEPTPYPLGRIACDDPHSANFLMSMDLEPQPLAALPPSMYHVPGFVLNQKGNSCVGASGRGFLECTPVPVPRGTGPDYWTIYQETLKRDHISGEADTGTTLIALMNYFMEAGLITRYVWAESMDSLIRWILTKGPVILGVPWTSGMFEPDRNAVIRPTGNVVGGHALLATGYDMKTGFFRLQNSWGSWGPQRGRCWLHYWDAKRLILEMGGEAVSPSEPGS